MRTVTIDARHIQTVAGLQRYIEYLFDFPAHYGRNLDALHDMLRTRDVQTRIVLIAAQEPGGELAAYLPRLLRVLEDSAQENARLQVEWQRAQ